MGQATIVDIIEGLKHPLHDIPGAGPAPILREDVIMSLDDLCWECNYKAWSATRSDFGAFVDIGVKQDGLIHI